MPPIRHLALAWGTSPRTVHLVIGEAVKQGRLETRQGAGVWLKGTRPVARLLVPKMDAARLANAIEAGIRTGKLGAGQTLPAAKDYCQLHGIHPVTARKAFALLLGKGLLERQGRVWKVAGARPRTGGRTPVLLCIGAADADGRLRMDTDREWDFWREIQAEAVRCGMEPRLVPWSGSLPRIEKEVLGVCVSTWHLLDSAPVLDALVKARLPGAVWVGNDEIQPARNYRHVRTMWFHDLAFGKEAGQTMGSHVALLGHRKVAWISPFHGSTWSRNRLAGLRKGMEGMEIELLEAVGPWVSEWDLKKDVHLDPAVLGRIDLNGLGCGAELASLAGPLVECIIRDRALLAFGPRLEAALGSGATLWVAASDLVARWCLHWLREKGLEVPRDLALAGFDDSRDATRMGLTSLRFDVQGMARAMLRQILSSRQPHSRFTRYDGAVMARASTPARTEGVAARTESVSS